MYYETVNNCQIKGLSEIYSGVFGNRSFGRFIEIGAYDGINFSNTFGLLRSGWKGLYAEPVKEFYDQCINNLKNYSASVQRVALGNTTGMARMVVAGTLSTYEQAHINAPVWKNEYKNAKTEDIKLTTLDLFLKENLIESHFDLLVIDTEGSELKVLEGFTLEYWKPTMVIVEAHEYSPYKELTLLAPEINKFFYSYRKIYSDEINNIYIL